MSVQPTSAKLALTALAMIICGCQVERASNEEAQARATGIAPKQSAQTATGFAAMDTRADGQLTSEEHTSAAARMFETMDGDRDGVVTAAELDAASSALGASTKMSSADKIKVVDANGDGQLSRQEHVDGSKAMFAKMDVNANGTLSQAEFEAGHKAMLGS